MYKNMKKNKLTAKEKYEMKKAQKKNKSKPKPKGILSNKIKEKLPKIIGLTTVVLLVIGLVIMIKNTPEIKHLPPNSSAGHIEESPPVRISTQEISEPIQKHMLEHANGKGAPGVLVQYNCKDYECEGGLVDKLTTLVKELPKNVYLAPSNYDGKIILTKEGKIIVLDSYDEKTIRDFVNK